MIEVDFYFKTADSRQLQLVRIIAAITAMSHIAFCFESKSDIWVKHWHEFQLLCCFVIQTINGNYTSWSYIIWNYSCHGMDLVTTASIYDWTNCSNWQEKLIKKDCGRELLQNICHFLTANRVCGAVTNSNASENVYLCNASTHRCFLYKIKRNVHTLKHCQNVIIMYNSIVILKTNIISCQILHSSQ